MVHLARGAMRGRGVRGARGGPLRGRGMRLPPPLMTRNNVMPPPPPIPRIPPRMRPLPPHGMRSPPFVPPVPPPHMRLPHPHPRPTPPHGHGPLLRRPLPFPPPIPPHRPMFAPHGRMSHMHPPPLIRGRGRVLRGMDTRQIVKMRSGLAQFKPKKGRKVKPIKEKSEGDFFCETCDRGFKTKEKLEEHCDEHVACGVDGCTLVAHSKIIQKHIQLQHDSGLFCKIANKTSPAEVDEWIKERKRKFPTKKVIEEKMSEEAEMEQRGERIRDDKSRFSASDKRTRGINTKGKWVRKEKSAKKGRRRPNKLHQLQVSLTSEIDQEDSWNGSLPHFLGTAMFDDLDEERENEKEKDDGYSDSEWNDGPPQENAVKSVASVLTALANAYGSDTESVDDNVKDNQEKPNVNNNCVSGQEIILNKGVVKEKSNGDVAVDDDSGPEEVAVLRHEASTPAESGATNDVSNEAGRKGTKRSRKRKLSRTSGDAEDNLVKKDFGRPVTGHKKRLTLLQKLLEPEIRHERNVILQCIRYVVQNNMFDIIK